MNRFIPYLIGLLIISIGLNIAQAIDRVKKDRGATTGLRVISQPITETPEESWIDKKIKNQDPSFVLLNASPEEYLNKKITLYGYARISDYYNYAYLDFNLTHYAVSISQKDAFSEYITVYFPKNKKNKEFIKILAKHHPDAVPVKVTVIENRFSLNQTQYLAEGLDWEVLK